jgi:hypothetical protein
VLKPLSGGDHGAFTDLRARTGGIVLCYVRLGGIGRGPVERRPRCGGRLPALCDRGISRPGSLSDVAVRPAPEQEVAVIEHPRAKRPLGRPGWFAIDQLPPHRVGRRLRRHPGGHPNQRIPRRIFAAQSSLASFSPHESLSGTAYCSPPPCRWAYGDLAHEEQLAM